MACDLSTVVADSCVNGIGRETNPIALLRIIAQTSADYLLAVDPTADISVEAIMQRACESGIGRETNEIALLQLIAQSLCDQNA